MPPKSASTTWPPRQTGRAIAETSVHNLNPITPIHFQPPSATASTSTAATPLQSAAVPTSSQSSQEATSIRAPNTNTTSHAVQSLTSPETSTPDLGFMNTDNGYSYDELGNRVNLENSDIQPCAAEKTTDVDSGSSNGGGNGIQNAVGLSCTTGETPQMPDGVAGTGTRKRTIVRKTVRVVKKLIKKRVPKRVLNNGLGNRGEEVKVEDGMKLSEVRTNGNLAADDVVEKSNHVDELVEETGRVSETKDTTNTGNDLIENLNLQNDADRVKETACVIHDVVEKANIRVEALNNLEIVNAPVIGEEVDDLSAQMESEMSKPGTHANFSEQMVLTNYQTGLNTTYEDDVKGNGVLSQVERDLMKPFCEVERKDLLEVEKVNPGTVSETDERENAMTENQSNDCLMENQRIDIARKADSVLLAGQDIGPGGEEIGFWNGREDVRSIAQAESCSGEVESNCLKLSEGLLLSGEMEALARKKKRKTEIFIGGLDKYTKEEDIREVFKDVGLVEEVRLVMNNPKSGKNRGYGFLRFATAADARNALAKYSKVEICGKQCNTASVEGNDTIFLGNIDRNWKTEDVVKLLEKAGIEKIDEVTLKADPNNIERNRGFAFVEFQTSKDAQTAFKKLQKKDLFGKTQVVKVAWAQPLSEPAEEEILQVKSVYAEYLPSSWDEEKVKEYFKRFGEIESVALAKDLSSSRRQDFAFINYTNRDAALTCIEAVNRERLEDDCSKVNMAVSLAKPIPKRKHTEHTSNSVSRQHLEEKANTSQTSRQLQGPRKKGKAASSNYDQVKVDTGSSTTAELVQLLRQQASSMHDPPQPGSGTIMPDHRFQLSGSKRPFSQGEHGPLYVDRQRLSGLRVESSYQISGPSSLSQGGNLFSPYHHQRGPGLPSQSINGRIIYTSHFQTRDRASFYEGANRYHRH